MRNFPIILGSALIGAAILLGLGLASDFVTFDETAHIAAGYSYLATGDFRMNPEHPPLVKILAGLALAPLHPALPTDTASWRDYNEWDFGRQFLLDNRVPTKTLITVARIPMVLLTLGLLAMVGTITYRRFGITGASLTLLVAAFDPLLLAHGHLVTTDVPLAFALFASVWSFVRFLDRPSRARALIAIALFTAAQLTKFSADILVVLLPAIALFRAWQLKRFPTGTAWTRQSIRRTILAFIVIPVVLILSAYRFTSLRPNQDPRIHQLYVERDRLIQSGEINQALPLTKLLVNLTQPGTRSRAMFDRILSIPILGYPYLRGQFAVASHSYGGHAAYLLGQHSHLGWWYYFPVAFAVKTPSGTLILTLLLIVAAGMSLRVRIRERTLASRLANASLETVAFTAIPIVYFLWSMTSHLDLGVRYLLPVYPFLWIGIGSLTKLSVPKHLYQRWLLLLFAIAISVPITTLLDAPHFIPSFNTFVGGSRNGLRYLDDSNVDWGQDLVHLQQELQRRGAVKPYVSFFGSLPLDRFIPDAHPLPTDSEVARSGLPHGWVAISLNNYLDPNAHQDWIKQFKPVELIGNSIALYQFP